MKKNKDLKQKILSLLSGVLIGIINGFFGAGGGMLCVPLLEKVMKTENKKAHSTALMVMLPLSIVSSVVYSLSFSVDWFMVIFVGVGFIAGGAFGAGLLKKLNNKVIRIIFSILVFASGLKMVI